MRGDEHITGSSSEISIRTLFFELRALIIVKLNSMNQEHNEVSTKLIKITLMSLLFMTIELVGGYLANSIAIFADAFHLLSDVLAYLISLGAVWLSTKPNPPKYLTFGWEKAQPLGALINIAIIYVVTAELFIEATKRMINKETVDQPLYMLITSIFGLLCNLITINILHSDPHGGHNCQHSHGHGHNHAHGHNHTHDHTGHTHGHAVAVQSEEVSGRGQHEHSSTCSHNHGHSHEHSNHGECSNSNNTFVTGQSVTLEQNILSSVGSDEQIKSLNKKIKNINLEAAYIHIITDIILSIGVVISAITIYFTCPEPTKWTAWQIADPLCTYLFSILAIYSTWPILKEAVLLLMDASHSPGLVAQIENQLNLMEEIKEIVELKIWSTNRDKNYGAVRVKMNEGYGAWRVRRVLSLRGVHGFVEVEEEEMKLQEAQ